MRIIAGKYGSRRIDTRKSYQTRPTLDKVREAVFSSLGGMFAGGVFIDLYAGSGANGFEAISRGMDSSWFIDNNHEAVSYIKKNARELNCMDQCHILMTDALKGLKIFTELSQKADVIYMDPPYARQKNMEILEFIDQNLIMNDQGTIMIESDKKDTFYGKYNHLQFTKEKIYGITRITTYTYKETL